MRTYAADEAEAQFDQLLDVAQREPVRLVRDGRVLKVMVSAEEFEAARAFHVHRLLRTMDEVAEGAGSAGLTDATLSGLLADES